MTVLVDIPEVTEVVQAAQTVVQQVLALPINSVIVVRDPRHGKGAIDTLLRTGGNGWLTSRQSPLGHGEWNTEKRYLNRIDVERWVDGYSHAQLDVVA